MKATAIFVVLVLTGCNKYITAQVTVTPEAVANSDKGVPGKVTGVVENRGDKDTLLDSQYFVWTPGQVDPTFDLRVEKGTTVVTILTYPGGPTARKTAQVPVHPDKRTWPFPVTINAVDLTTQTASIDFLQRSAEDLSLVSKPTSTGGVDGGTTPPSTNYEQVAKYMGALTIVPDKWDPNSGVIDRYIANVRVLSAPPAPESGIQVQKKLSITTDASAKVALSIPVYGSLGASLQDGTVYKMNFDIMHSAVLDLDQGIFKVLLDGNNKDGAAALAELEYWAGIEPTAKVVTLRAVRYIVKGTIGVTQGKNFASSMDAAVASGIYLKRCVQSFSLND